MQYDLYKDAKGEWRWNLTADNGRVLAVSSEGYKRKIDASRCIELVMSSTSAEIHVQKKSKQNDKAINSISAPKVKK